MNASDRISIANRGAYYTPSFIAKFLAQNAIQLRFQDILTDLKPAPPFLTAQVIRNRGHDQYTSRPD